MCLQLRGFYLKAGQFLATRHDLVPGAWCRTLATLHDSVPPMPAAQVREIVEAEAGRPLEDVFESIDLEVPLGSASIGQVHRAVLRHPPAGAAAGVGAGAAVAVKVQNPEAERTMLGDLDQLRVLAGLLQRFELPFDLLSPLRELRRRVACEFDFVQEAATMLSGHRHRKAFIFPKFESNLGQLYTYFRRAQL